MQYMKHISPFARMNIYEPSEVSAYRIGHQKATFGANGCSSSQHIEIIP